MRVTATETRIVVDGRALARAAYPVTIDPEIGVQFRLSDMGPNGSTSYRALFAAVAYNSTDNEYLVVWYGDDDTGGVVDNECEIFGQLVDGATGAEIGDQGTPPAEAMRKAINANTAAIFYLASALNHKTSVPFAQAVAMAHAASVPLIVDAASECPPLSALTRFVRAGADLVIFSGGKSIMGPQSTGLIIGRQDLIAACAANGNPFATVGRPMKVSREEVIAFLKALELYLARDHAADRERWEAQVRHIEEALKDIPHFAIGRFAKGETYEVPLLNIRPEAGAGITPEKIAEALQEGEPRIVVAQHLTPDSVVVNPHMLQPGQERIVAERCREVLTQAGSTPTRGGS